MSSVKHAYFTFLTNFDSVIFTLLLELPFLIDIVGVKNNLESEKNRRNYAAFFTLLTGTENTLLLTKTEKYYII